MCFKYIIYKDIRIFFNFDWKSINFSFSKMHRTTSIARQIFRQNKITKQITVSRLFSNNKTLHQLK